MLLLLTFAFLSGFVTILAPCIWPILPIVLSSAIAGKGGHKRPLGITLGVMLSFTIFTLSASTLITLFHLDPSILRLFAVIVIGFLGLTMIVPFLTTRFEVFVSRLANRFGTGTQNQSNEFLPGFLTGLSLGIVWSPCAGPILAAIATLAATGRVSFEVILVTVAYVLGVGIPLFAFAYGGQRFITRVRGINKYTRRIQQIFGVVMIIAAFLIYTNKDKEFQLALINHFPALGAVVNGFENSTAVTDQLNKLKGSSNTYAPSSKLFNANVPAPEFAGITQWLNPKTPLSMRGLRGKVVLVDFWTYTCINCIRTLPYVTKWYDKYHDQGFVVVGVHTPEFAFEKETKNVEQAIEQFSIHYPVAQDNDYGTWFAYSNNSWPAEYLIDSNGVIRRVHIGEGEYDKMELAIQMLLKEAGKKVNDTLETVVDSAFHEGTSPETYVGSRRMEYLQTTGSVGNGAQSFILDENTSQNHFSFGGNWNIADEYSVAGKNASLLYNFNAEHVYLVLKRGTAVHGKIKVFLDGKVVDTTQAGKDVKNGIVTVNRDRMYDIIDLKGSFENHVLRLEFQTPGIQVYTFTFG